MKSAVALLSIGTGILQIGSALSLHQRNDAQPRVVSIDLQRAHVQDILEHDRNRLARRDGTLNATIDNEATLYYINTTIGTPGQPLRLHLDTGSSDLWVNTPKSSMCTMGSNLCASSGTYVANSSSTYKYVGSYFNISYIDGSGASGDYATDNVRIAGQEIKDLQFGIGYTSTSRQGILGLGYPVNEVQVVRNSKSPYQNLPARMVSEGIIASSAFSMWLNGLYSNAGTILFGGVDRARYEGDLITLPIQKSRNTYSEFYITMTGLDVGSKNLQKDMKLGVLLDSGSSLTYLPNNLVSAIYSAVNATYQEDQGVAVVPCALRKRDLNITFSFSKPAIISVPVSQMIFDLQGSPTYTNGEPACMFGIAPAGTSTKVLGDTFLRSAYVVYDLDNNQISMAQSKLKVTKSDIVAIGKGKNAVPAAVTATGPIAAESGVPEDTSSSGVSISGFGTALTITTAVIVSVVASWA